MNFIKGNYKVKAGYDAVVARIRSNGTMFVLEGAIYDPAHHTLVFHAWGQDGHSFAAAPDGHNFDLVEKAS